MKKIALTRWSIRGVIAVLLMALSGCLTTGGGLAIRYNADYYEPYGYAYSGLRDYRVGPPPRGGYEHPERSNARPSRPAYRPAPPSRLTPSIPTQPRGGHPHGDGKDDDRKGGH